MKWVLFTMLLCAVGPTQASAQNEISQQLLELDQDQRNAAFTRMLWDTKRKCDHVIRTLFNGTVLGVDDWEVLCRDRRSYSISTARHHHYVAELPRIVGDEQKAIA